MGVPQPFYAEWAPGDDPGEPSPTWLTLPAMRNGSTCQRGGRSSVVDGYAQGTAKLSFKNGNNAGEAETFDSEQLYRNRRIRIMVDDIPGFVATATPIWTGYVRRLDHNADQWPAAAFVDIEAVDASGVWVRQNVARDTDDSALDDGALGWPTTAAELADEIDQQSLAIGTPDVLGDARAPVTLPVRYDTVEGGARIGRFTDKAQNALAKALEVEIGSVHIAADGTPVVNGRYAVPDEYATGPTPATFTMIPGDIDPSSGAFAYFGLKWADVYSSHYSGAATAGLTKKTYTSSIATPPDLFERLDLWCADDNWVEANAELLRRLLTTQAPAPAEISVVVWDTAMSDFSCLAAVLDATSKLGRRYCNVVTKSPGSASQFTWQCLVEGVRWSFTAAQVVATLQLSAVLANWLAGYDLSTGIFALDVAGRGLDSGAILGP